MRKSMFALATAVVLGTAGAALLAQAADDVDQQPARQPWLNEVPVAEQHCVGHRSEERCTGERPRHGQYRRAATGPASGNEPDHAGRRREKIQPRVEICAASNGNGERNRSPCDQQHCRDFTDDDRVEHEAGDEPTDAEREIDPPQ